MTGRTDRLAELDRFFNPRGVAIIGSLSAGTAAGVPLTQLQRRFGDQFHLVNRRGGDADGRPVHRRVSEIAAEVDLAVISVGIDAVNDILVQCGARGIRYAIIFTAGYSETGPAGAQRERQLLETARRAGIRILGPNTNTNAFEVIPEVPARRGGNIALVTQSGGQGRPLVQAAAFGVAFSRWVPTGNEVDLDAADFIEYFAYDDETRVIAGYFEGFRDSVKLRNALAAAASQGKPVVALKIGTTDEGARAAGSHTGHLAGSDAAIDGLFRQYGVTRVRDLDELLETAALFAKLPPDTGAKVCCYTGSGGSGALMTELAASHGVATPELAAATQDALGELLPGYLIRSNPVDNGTVFAVAAEPAERRRALQLMASDPSIDMIVVGIPGPLPGSIDNLVADLHAFADTSPVPIAVTWTSMVTQVSSFDALIASRLPFFRSNRNCFAAIRSWAEFRRPRPQLRSRPYRPAPANADMTQILSPGGIQTWADTVRLLAQAGIPTTPTIVADSPEAASKAAAETGGWCVMKVASTRFAHKSDHGLVRLGVDGPDEAGRAYADLVAAALAVDPEAPIEGVLVQPQVPDGVEMIVGVWQDPVVGPCVLVGSGGILAEVVGDVSIRPVPLTDQDIDEMLRELRGYPLLTGTRGRPPADVAGLRALIAKVAVLAERCGPALSELDLNPVIVGASAVEVVDALVVAS